MILRYFYQFARLVLLLSILIALFYELTKAEIDKEAVGIGRIMRYRTVLRHD